MYKPRNWYILERAFSNSTVSFEAIELRPTRSFPAVFCPGRDFPCPNCIERKHSVKRRIHNKRGLARDKKFEYGLVLDWYGTVHIGIASGLLSLSETWNEVSRYGSSMVLKTGQLTTVSNDPAAIQSIKGESPIRTERNFDVVGTLTCYVAAT